MVQFSKVTAVGLPPVAADEVQAYVRGRRTDTNVK